MAAGVVGHKTPHMMRAFVATKLANDPTVSSAEVQAALRHTSVVSQQAYIVPTVASEINRVKALGVEDTKPAATDDTNDTKPPAKKKAKKKRSKNLQFELPPNDPRSKGPNASMQAPIAPHTYWASQSMAMAPPNPYAPMMMMNPYAMMPPMGFGGPYAPPPNPYAPSMPSVPPFAAAAPQESSTDDSSDEE